jgi:maleamate amidohydrolase
VIVKKRASAFHGTYLSSFLKAHGIDTVVVTGVTMAGCVRHTVEDAIAEGFRPIVVRKCVGDRLPRSRRMESLRHLRQVRRCRAA